CSFFFFQAEDGIRDFHVTGVQTCALPILNYELKYHLQRGERVEALCTVLDTLALARKMHPGQRNSLDALCKRYEIDNSQREYHRSEERRVGKEGRRPGGRRQGKRKEEERG